MKRLIILITLIIGLGTIEAKFRPAPQNVSFGFFYSSLRPYGDWIEIDADVYAWRPFPSARDWKPYSDGRWSWTSNGWYWDSYEPFGWATYHYGRWYCDDYYGWIWMPDYEWGPAWVEWRYDNDYIGWAPLPPYAQFRIDLGIHFSISWHSHYTVWNFVPYNRFCDHRMNHYIIDHLRSYAIFERTKYRTNYFMDRNRLVNGGIDRSFIEKKSGYRIQQRDIHEVDDYRNYEKSRGSNKDRIVSYKPSGRELMQERNFDKTGITRGQTRTSLDREKILIDRKDNPISRDRDNRDDSFKDRTNNNSNSNRERDIPKVERNDRENNDKNISREEIKKEPRVRENRTEERQNKSTRSNENRTERNNRNENRSGERRR